EPGHRDPEPAAPELRGHGPGPGLPGAGGPERILPAGPGRGDAGTFLRPPEGQRRGDVRPAGGVRAGGAARPFILRVFRGDGPLPAGGAGRVPDRGGPPERRATLAGDGAPGADVLARPPPERAERVPV